MKAKFEIRTFLGENRETIISSYERLKNETHFNGCTLKSFMMDVMQCFTNNRIASEKTAIAKLPFLLDVVYFENCVKIQDSRQSKLEAKYEGTAYMAIV
jgi:hypothetical protein